MSNQAPSALPAGMRFHGRYEIVRCLKAGGMGAVYEAIHLQTRKRRALNTAREPGARFDRASTMVVELARALGVASPGLASGAPIGVPGPGLAPPENHRALAQQPPLDSRLEPGGAPAFTGPRTTGAVTSDRQGAPAGRSRAPAAVVAVAMLGAGALGLGLFMMTRSAAPGATATGAAASIVVDRTPEPVPSASATAPPAVTAAPVVVPGEPSASVAARPLPPRTGAGAAPRPSAAAGSPAPAAKNCNPPYVIDGAGHRQYKPECL